MKFEETEIFNFEGAIRGMRNPLNSWDKSDSHYPFREAIDSTNTYIDYEGEYEIGTNDLTLMRKLIIAGNDHCKFLRQIMLSVDITAPLYWWKEWETYKVGTVSNSCSTMHKLTSIPITKECFEIEKGFENEFEFIINKCENLRQKYLETKEKSYWKLLIQLLPNSWLQKRTITLNYAVLRNMYTSRKNHKLTEWSIEFINWINSLPYSKELIKGEYEND